MKQLRKQLTEIMNAEGWEEGEPIYTGKSEWTDMILEFINKYSKESVFISLMLDSEWVGNSEHGHEEVAMGISTQLPHTREEAEEILIEFHPDWESSLAEVPQLIRKLLDNSDD